MQIVMSIAVPHEVPAAAFDAAMPEIDDRMPRRRRGLRRNEGFEPDQQYIAGFGVVEFGHVVVGGDHIPNLRLPSVGKEAPQIEFLRLAAGRQVEAQDARHIAFDSGKQNFACTARVRDRGQSPQTALGMPAGTGIGVDRPPIRRGAVDPLIDLLSDGGIQAAIAFGEGADAQSAARPGEPGSGIAPDAELRGGVPADRARHPRVVGAAENAARTVAGEYTREPCRFVAIRKDAADLRQKIPCGRILR